MSATQLTEIAPPLPIAGLLQSKWANSALKTAIELDLFSALSGGPADAEKLAHGLKVDANSLRLLLNALCAMEFLIKKGELYQLTDLSAAYLVGSSDLYMGEYIIGHDLMDNAWKNLTQAITTGKPQQAINEPAAAQEFFPKLARNIFPLNFSNAVLLADHLQVATKAGPVRVLDLAAGSGVWSLPMARANRNVQVDALDFPSILQVTKEFAAKYGVANQYQYLSGNWREIPLTQGSYDIIILGHILHSEGQKLSERLLQYCTDALKTGGMLVVAEFISNDAQNGPLFAQLFALNMLLMTSEGCVFTESQLKQMLEGAGLKQPRRLELPYWGAGSPLMVATK